MNTSTSGTSKSSWRILYADDVRELRVLVEQILSKDGHTVKCVEDGRQAWAELENTPTPYDLVISDHNMPQMNGLDLVQRLRCTAFAGKIVVVSSELSEAVDQAYHDLQVDRVFKKPFSFSRLRNLVAELRQSTA